MSATRNLNDDKVSAPDGLNASLGLSGPLLREWFERLQLYTEAMADLGRITVLSMDDKTVYCASVSDEP